VRREVNSTQEVLLIKSGRVRIDYYDNSQNYFESKALSKGDVVLLSSDDNALGSFGRLIQWASAKFMFPLPLGAVNNVRSLIAIDNLVSFIITCTQYSKAANDFF
jgi:hypothetical protein